VGSGAGVWNTGSTPTINSSGQITISMNPGTVNDTIYVRVCSNSSATACSSGTRAVTVTSSVPQGFYLSFPLQYGGWTPYTAQITTVFDHAMTARYYPGGGVVAYTGESGTEKDLNEPQIDFGNGLLFSFKKADGTPFVVNGNYVGTQGGNGTGPTTLNYDGHPGYDFPVPIGTDVFAAADGQVIVADPNSTAAGNYIRIQHGSSGYQSQYLHLSSNLVTVGDTVTRGQLIGKSGNTAGVGNSVPAHLHFEVKQGTGNTGIQVDPYGWEGSGADPYALATNVNLWNAHGGGSQVLGVDVSFNNGTVDWNMVRNAGGKTFALIHATGGVNTTDLTFAANVAGARSAGLLVGAYHFAYPEYFTAHEEAQKFLSVAAAYIGAGYLPPILDIEDSPSENSYPYRMGKAALSQWIRDWSSEVEQATGVAGRKVILYAFRWYLNNYCAGGCFETDLNQHPLWVATYPADPATDPGNIGPWSTWTFQQYRTDPATQGTSANLGGTCPGITGYADLDSFNGDLTALNALGGTSVDGTPPTISLFNVSPFTTTLAQPFTINYTVSDSGGSGLNHVVLRRTSGNGSSSDPGWADINTNPAVGNGPVNGSVSDIPPSVGTYWYGMAAFDNAGNSGDERQSGLGPVQRTVTSVSYTIALSASPSAGGTVSGDGTFAAGSSRTVAAAANSGYSFVNWTESGSVVSSSASYTFTLNASRVLIANFTTVNYTIALSASPSAGGTVSGDGTFAAGSSRTVMASANSGYTFANWTESGGVVSSSASYTFTLNATRNFVATFTPSGSTCYTLSTGTSPGGVGSVSVNTGQNCTGGYTANTGISLTANPLAGYSFTGWSGSGGTFSSTSANPTTFTITGNATVTATFGAVLTQTLQVAKAGTGTGSVFSIPLGIACGASCSASFASGTAVTLTAVPDTGSLFSGWSGGGCSGSVACAVTMATNQFVTATFGLAPVLPKITSFTAIPAVRSSAGASTLAWTTTGATSVTIAGLTGPFSLSGSTVVSVGATSIYLLTATGTGGSVTASVTVNVLPPPGGGMGTPVITAPAEGQVIGVAAVSFAWNAVTGATGYDARLLATSNGAILFAGSLSGNGSTSALITLPNGTYSFGVRACNGAYSDATCGSYATRTFTVIQTGPTEAPTVTIPAEGAVLKSSIQLLAWTGIAKPDPTLDLRYEVLLTDVAAGNKPELQIAVPDPNLSTVYTLHSSGLYELKVRACQAGCGPWSVPVTFTVDIKQPPTTAPDPPTCAISGLNTLTCSWNPVNGAEYYSIYLIQPTAGPGGGALTVAARLVSDTTVVLPVPPGHASMIVAACTGDGCGPWSQDVSIDPPGPSPSAPSLGTPLGGSVVDGPIVSFSWNRIPGDDGSNTWYRLYVQDLSRSTAALDVYTKQNYWAAYFKAEGARYDALVIANPGLSNEIAGPATGFNVRGASATAPTMVAPAHQSTVKAGNVMLAWTPVPGATLYQYYVASATNVVQGVTPGLIVQVPLMGTGGGTLYNGITRACMSLTGCSPISDTGWGPWSNAPGGPGVTTFTVIP
jgi:murein DD-endopeptidase MepM/ murein hydrolase activator NlpD/GH25 family lysozyme M1 (1,4-beta-N-acetylmuramidase)